QGEQVAGALPGGAAADRLPAGTGDQRLAGRAARSRRQAEGAAAPGRAGRLVAGAGVRQGHEDGPGGGGEGRGAAQAPRRGGRSRRTSTAAAGPGGGGGVWAGGLAPGGASPAAKCPPPALRATRRQEGAPVKPTDIRVADVSFAYEDYLYRTPIKFGGTAVDRVTLLNVRAVVETRSGKVARGFGSMPLGNVWSFPSRVLGYDDARGARKAVAGSARDLTAACTEVGPPIALAHALEPQFHAAAAALSRELRLAEPIPHLCTLVVASPFDAAVHD